MAGTGAPCSAPTAACGDGGAATSAQLKTPTAVAVDLAGNIYIADTVNQRVRKVDTTGQISTIAGTGNTSGAGCVSTSDVCGDGGLATQAMLHNPEAVQVDQHGNVYFSDSFNQRIRRVSGTTGIITTIAGNGTTGSSGDGGQATSATLNNPYGMALDPAGFLYISTTGDNRVRKIDLTTGIITTVSGNGATGYAGDGGLSTSATLNSPNGIAVDAAGNVFFSDFANRVVRKIAATTGIISTVAGNGSNGFGGDGGVATAATLAGTSGLALDSSGNLYMSDTLNSRVREVIAVGATGCSVPNAICTIAGNGATGYSGDGGAATSASHTSPAGLGVDAFNNVYVAGIGVNAVRKISTSGTITTVAGGSTACPSPTATCGDGGPAINAQLNTPTAVAFDGAGNLFIADTVNQRIRKVDGSGIITTVVGNGNTSGTGCTSTSDVCGDGGPAQLAYVHNPEAVQVDLQGNLYFSDSYNQRIRKVDPSGTITTIAGTGVAGSSGDGGAAVSATLNNPYGMVLDRASGYLYIATAGDNRVRRVNLASNVITTVAGTGAAGYSGDGGVATSATLNSPNVLSVDGMGNLYISDFQNHVVREVNSSNGVIHTLAGNGSNGFSGDGGNALSASLAGAGGLAVDKFGNLYISDTLNNRVRRMARGDNLIVSSASSTVSAAVGDLLEINGQGFGSTQGGNTITIGGVTALVIYWSSSRVVAIIPDGAANGTAQLTVGGSTTNVSFDLSQSGSSSNSCN
uniref:NHL domain-containing protein n=1 Tax=Terriglobus albidus TaxID=1592106 RepID=UPI0021DFDD36|nr:SMP-30/gluconolactonase/LRE family protein [Terriglobus albidus]